MSVFMTLQVSGDPKGMEQYAQDNPDKMRTVLEAAKSRGLIAHRMYGSDDGGKVMVLDEWPDRRSFEAFFQEQESEIREMFEAVRASDQPVALFWEQLETGDAYGWGA